MKRAEFSRRTKLDAWDRAGGACEECRRKLFPGDRWEFDHVVPAALGGDNSLGNCALLCRECHLRKFPEDSRTIAKSRAVRAAHIGARKPKHPLPGSKGSKWKRKMDGTVVER